MLAIIRAVLFFPSVTVFKIMLLIMVTLAAALFEGFGVAMLFPVMDFIEKGKDFSVLANSSKMWLYITKIFDFFSIPKSLLSLMGIVFCLLILRQVFNYIRAVYGNWITESFFSSIRSAGFRWLARADMAFYDTHGVGQLINVLTVDGIRAGSGIFSFFNLLAAATIFSIYFVFLFVLTPRMTLFAIAIMGCVGLILRSRVRKSGEIGLEVSRHNEKIASSIVERLNGMRLLKTSATEEVEADFVEKLSEKIKIETYSLARIKARMEFFVDPIVILAGLMILYFSVEVFHMTLAKTGIFIFVLLRLMPYTKDMFNSRQGLAGLSGSLFRVKMVLEKAQKAESIKSGTLSDVSIKEAIRFENVCFSYGGGATVLENVSMIIPAGKMTALVGRSGAGKSTLVDLIPRLRAPDKGKITIDGRPIDIFALPALRRSIAFVSQEGFLFNDTIENNIKYCRPEATMDQIVEAARSAYIDHTIREFPNGYKTIVGERGFRLSGGQRQRVILARALLQGASILILDEPTSSLDSESELFIQKAMRLIRTAENVTMIIIAHRLSTIKSADQIVVLDRGKVIECGSHRDLIHEDTWYADMVKMQAVG